jgi:ubiquinone/menaquinone biosynthesis C-methylase UbiE
MAKNKDPSQHEIWNSIAKVWKEYRTEPNSEVKSFLTDKSGFILDLGCGSGRNFKCISSKSLLYAVDFSEEMVSYAKEQAQKLKLNADVSLSIASSLPFKDNMFDCAIFVATLHCIESASDRLKAVKELFRVLKPGSQALVTVWSKNHARISNKTKDQCIPWGLNGIKLQRYYYIYDQDEFVNLLKSVGFDIVSVQEDNNIVAVVRKPA